jgi:hypothetical protein
MNPHLNNRIVFLAILCAICRDAWAWVRLHKVWWIVLLLAVGIIGGLR